MRRLFPAALLLTVLCACAPAVPFAPPTLTPTRPLTSGELLTPLWTAPDGIWRLRQSGLFELRGRRLPLSGFLQLDTRRQTARLVGMNDMGVKFFDLTVMPETTQEHFLLPELAATPGLSGAVATAVRRIFLVPQPRPDDVLDIGRDRYRLSRREAAGTVEFLFGGEPPLLLEKSTRGAVGEWRARYYEYRDVAGRRLPGGIVLEDARAGYRLTLWLEEARKVDE